jgi:ABC-2 type transport system ATP-binding protein
VEKVEIKQNLVLATLKTGVEDYTELSAALLVAGQRIKLFREEEINLETAFMLLTQGLGKRT